ncbi:hypothetical protein ARMSODRAFT_40868 [Armillaria solidipes]|uniref:DUF6535 domain-containing protein n=1 Tax=Armillaria solidipes TaxID=1076256 RepID=A0A2H3C5S3_9AGAR|nr:hypothetical protein ARMSODRAFT_40868 [Armillaria solidipes]
MSNTDTITGDAVLTTAEAKAEKDSKSKIVEAEENGTTGQAYPEYVHPTKSARGLDCEDMFLINLPKATILLSTRKSILKMLRVKKWVPTLGYFGRTSMNARYMTRIWLKSREMALMFCSFSSVLSVVVTTFVTQTSQSLQADYTEMSANLLFEMINIQRAIAGGASLDTVAASPLNPNTMFIASTTSIWVNGLWFTSLALSLTTALASVLVKQWLHHYMALPSGTPRERSLLQQFRFGGLQKWCVLVIIGLLPALMHTALAVFFVGLVIFLGDSLAWVVGAVTTLTYTAYLMALILPLISPQCPTSLCDLLHVLYSCVMQYTVHCLRYRFCRSEMNLHAKKWKGLKELESDAVQSVWGELSVEAFIGSSPCRRILLSTPSSFKLLAVCIQHCEARLKAFSIILAWYYGSHVKTVFLSHRPHIRSHCLV